MPRSDHFDPPEPPPDEAWWERALFQNEKMIDKYMDVLDSEDSWTKYDNPRDLYNKVHYGIEPGEPLPPGVEDDWSDDDDPFAAADEPAGVFFEDGEVSEADESSSSPTDLESVETADDPFADNDPREMIIGGELLSDEDLAEYQRVYHLAFEFGVAVMKLEDLPEASDGLRLAACKVAVNLTGGHGLGYAEGSLCGNIVKCRWALAECDFSLDGLQFLVERGRSDLAPLLEQGRSVRKLVEERIVNLRSRVWW